MKLTIDEIIRLKNEGFTAEEIQGLSTIEGVEPVKQTAAPQQPAIDQEALVSMINDKFEEFKKTVQLNNVKSANADGVELQKDPTEILGSILNPVH